MASAADVIASARSKLGARYVFGDEGPNTFDCSGLMQWAFGQHGVKIPRIAADQAKAGTTVPKGQQQPGDLIFSIWDGSPVPSHVSLYIGNNQYIHAPEPGDVVKIGTLNEGYWSHVTNVQRMPLSGGTVPTGGGGGGGLPGLPTPGDVTGAVAGAADALRSMAGGVTAVGQLAAKLGWLALPTSQVRIMSGALGVAFLLIGVIFLAREARG